MQHLSHGANRDRTGCVDAIPADARSPALGAIVTPRAAWAVDIPLTCVRRMGYGRDGESP